MNTPRYAGRQEVSCVRFVAAGLLAMLSACAELEWQRPREPDPGPPAEVSGPPGVSATRLGIPPGQLPPVGKCRIWYPGRPPGHQPKPAMCETLAGRIPPGAWLVMRRASEPGRIHVHVYDPDRDSVILRRQIFDQGTGELLQEATP